MDHYFAIQQRLNRELARVAAGDKSEFRAVQVAQARKELANEEAFLRARGLFEEAPVSDMSDDDLLRELGA